VELSKDNAHLRAFVFMALNLRVLLYESSFFFVCAVSTSGRFAIQ
jgi:hypothetical protein